MDDIRTPSAIRTDEIYATFDDNYMPSGVFQEWYRVDAPPGGCKIHVSAAEKSVDALMVATFVLPELRRLRVRHKIVRNFDEYRSLNRGDQRGKFITIYARSLVDRDRVKTALFMLTACAAALVAILTVLDAGSTDARRGFQKEFEAIIAAVIGGCLLTGGYGSAIGAFFGAIIFGMVSIGLTYTRFDSDWFQVFLGAMLLLAVLFNNFIRRKVTGER